MRLRILILGFGVYLFRRWDLKSVKNLTKERKKWKKNTRTRNGKLTASNKYVGTKFLHIGLLKMERLPFSGSVPCNYWFTLLIEESKQSYCFWLEIQRSSSKRPVCNTIAYIYGQNMSISIN